MHIKLDMKKERNMKTMNKEEKLTKAIIFATIKHANQKRKDGTPYIYHPLAVAELLKKWMRRNTSAESWKIQWRPQ